MERLQNQGQEIAPKEVDNVLRVSDEGSPRGVLFQQRVGEVPPGADELRDPGLVDAGEGKDLREVQVDLDDVHSDLTTVEELAARVERGVVLDEADDTRDGQVDITVDKVLLGVHVLAVGPDDLARQQLEKLDGAEEGLGALVELDHDCSP